MVLESSTLCVTDHRDDVARLLQSSEPVLLRDAGIITFADTFDLETGQFISSESIVNKGPHPEADSDFALFCEVISAALA